MDARYSLRFKLPKWNCLVSPAMDCKAMRFAFPGFTKADHLGRSAKAEAFARRVAWERERVTRIALDTYGDDGSCISGCVRDHFPAKVKDYLRGLAHHGSSLRAVSVSHWMAAGRRAETWRRINNR